MKQKLFRFLIPLFLFATPLAAEELPVLWLEAGKTVTCPVHSEGAWKLRSGHRILAGGTARVRQPMIQTNTPAVLEITLPPLKPGVRLQAELLLADQPVYKVVVAAKDPFEDRKNWFAAHPISLYDPEGKTAEILGNEAISFNRLSNFRNIVDHEKGVIVVGDGVDFETEKGLSEILFRKASDGLGVFVANPKGKVPLDFAPEIVSFLLTDDVRLLFPEGSCRIPDGAWILSAEATGLALVDGYLSHGNRFKGTRCGPTVLDVRFPDPEKRLAEPKGRIVFDKQFRFLSWPHDVETRYYFKSLIETLSDKGDKK